MQPYLHRETGNARFVGKFDVHRQISPLAENRERLRRGSTRLNGALHRLDYADNAGMQ
jgi:hypothetical protein